MSGQALPAPREDARDLPAIQQETGPEEPVHLLQADVAWLLTGPESDSRPACPGTPMIRTAQAVALTDLDGTLLDADCSWRGARDALERLAQAAIPLVPVTSKTRSEVEALLDEMEWEAPFVVENGAAVYLPPAYHHLRPPGLEPDGLYRRRVLGRKRPEILEFLRGCSVAADLVLFSSMSLGKIVEHTGLPPALVPRARARQFSEPFLVRRPEAVDTLRAEAAAQGLAIHRGGSFWHATDRESDKGRAVEILLEAFREAHGEVVAIGLGNDPHDAPFLERCDHAVLLPSRSNRTVPLRHPRLELRQEGGSSGWNRAVLDLLDRLELAPPATSTAPGPR